MIVRHPAPDELLLDYVVGATSPGKSLLVATHLAMCDESRARCALLAEVGGALLDQLDGRPLGTDASAILEAAGRTPGGPPDKAPSGQRPALSGASGEAHGVHRHLPGPLAALAGEVDARRGWCRLGFGVAGAELPVSRAGSKTQLLRAAPGTRIFKHTHLGEEAILLLKGAFWDQGERFGPGDVAVNDSNTMHEPVIDPDEECWWLAVSEGPIRFVGPLGPILNLFNRF